MTETQSYGHRNTVRQLASLPTVGPEHPLKEGMQIRKGLKRRLVCRVDGKHCTTAVCNENGEVCTPFRHFFNTPVSIYQGWSIDYTPGPEWGNWVNPRLGLAICIGGAVVFGFVIWLCWF